MKKVIVFRVEEVLVKGNDENRLEEMRGFDEEVLDKGCEEEVGGLGRGERKKVG